MTDPRVTASALLRHIAFWGDESRTREELLELADMIDRFEDGYCPLCQHICAPSCALYPVNAEAQEMEARKRRLPATDPLPQWWGFLVCWTKDTMMRGCTMEPFDIADLFPQRTEPIPRATADDELYVIKSNPGHIKWGKPDGSWDGYAKSYHIGYQTKWGPVALCGVGNDVIPTGCRCAPWHPKPERTETDCADCLNIAKSLHFEGKYPDGLE